MFSHISVLLKETIDSLNIKKDGIYVDGTLGGGGHASKVLERLNDNGMLIGIDQDEDAINFCKEKFKSNKKIKIVKNNFSNIKEILSDLNIKEIDGMYLDLGVSSFQFDEKERGFTYRENASLDMRMDKNRELSAKDIVNTFSEKDIADILWKFGEEKFSRSIAKRIIEYRNKKNIETTLELVDIIKSSIPSRFMRDKHPAKRTFQALRIYVNDELSVLEKVIDDSIDILKDGARLSIISFQSLEDRIVKEKFRKLEDPCTCPKGYPCVCGAISKGKVITRKAIVPSSDEIENNRRSHSAKLRVFERRKNV